MLWFSNLSFEVRVLAITLFGYLCMGPFTTWAIASWSYFGNRISPWTKQPRDAVQQRTWFHFVPVLGWFRRPREQEQWPVRFWIRPALIELLVPILLTSLYVWETEGNLLPSAARGNAVSEVDLHWHFLGHAILFPLLVIATFIDFDEMIIPDLITVPGTILGLLGAAFIPQWHLWVVNANSSTRGLVQMNYATPELVSTWVYQPTGLLLAIMMFLGWCFALANRRVITRRGWRKAIQFFFAGLVREPSWKFLLTMAFVGSTMIAIGYSLLSPQAWLSLFSALCGMTIGGGIVWFIRIVASVALRVEALGFGDVLLMAMVGSYLGWQLAGISFFYAPMFALPIVIVIVLLTGEAATPFGPYLCMATLYCLVKWDAIWNLWLQPVLAQFGDLKPVAILFLSMGLAMGGMLSLYRMFKSSRLQKRASNDQELAA